MPRTRVITQDTYNQAVKENMEYFGMTHEEATEEAVQQFESQGVDLTSLLTSASNLSIISKCVGNLEVFSNAGKFSREQALNEFHVLQTLASKNISRKILFAKEGAYPVLLSILRQFENDTEIFLPCLASLTLLMTGQPDILEEEGINLMMHLLESQTDQNIQCLILKWIIECCTKHEMNRQNIFNAGILDRISGILKQGSIPLLQEVCNVLRVLVLDDDIRVEFGKASVHARIIATETLSSLIELLYRYKRHIELIHDLLNTLSAIICRNEFCAEVKLAGGVDFLIEVLHDHINDQKLVRQGLKLLKILAGSDDCKTYIIEKGCDIILMDCIEKYQTNSQTACLGLNCIAALTLRSSSNSRALFEVEAPRIIVTVMRFHSDNIYIQKAASRAVRNMVCRDTYQIKTFLELGIEELLREYLIKFKDAAYDIKSALRDLNLEVELTEEWTGRGGKLTTQEKKKSDTQSDENN